jgi:F-box-like
MDLVRATAVCRRWRAIAIHTSDLWTKIRIHADGLDEKQSNKLLNRLSLFLGRTGTLLLDVEWHAYGNPKSVPLFYDLFRHKAPFSRWRTLDLDLNEEFIHPFEPRGDVDEFLSLEELTLMHAPPRIYLDHLNETVTARLRILELGPNFQCTSGNLIKCANIFGYISTIKLRSGVIIPPALLPPNVTTLKTNTMPNLPIPHVRHLFVKHIGVELLSTLGLANLVSLSIRTIGEEDPAQYTINLPSLLWLRVKDGSLPVLSCLKVPSLHTLSIECFDEEAQAVDSPVVTAIRTGFEAPKLLALFLNIYLDPPATLEILRCFPNISRVHLRCRGTDCARDILSHVFPLERQLPVCSGLDLLRVNLDIPPSNKLEWQDFVTIKAHDIGDPLWRLDSRWMGGKYSQQLGTGTQPKTPCIYPWKEDEQ